MIRLLLASMIAFYITPGNCLAEKVGPAQQLQYFGNRMVEGTWIQKAHPMALAVNMYTSGRWGTALCCGTKRMLVNLTH